MTPAPTTPADVIFRGDVAFDAGAFLIAVLQEEHVEKCPIDRRAEQLRELFRLHLAGRFDVDARRAEHDFQRRERRRVVALGLLLDISAGGGAEETELGFADLDRRRPTARDRGEIAWVVCSARIMRMAAARSASSFVLFRPVSL